MPCSFKTITHPTPLTLTLFAKLLTPFIYKRCTNDQRKATKALCKPHHISTSMKKSIHLLMLATKNLHCKGKKCILSNADHGKVFPLLESP